MASTDKVNFTSSDIAYLYDKIYPIGSIYMSTSNTNPGTMFGGTWVAWGSGKVPVGVDADNGNFNTVEKTGGALTHTHTGPSHTHTGPSHTHTIASHTHTGPSHTHTIASHAHTTGNFTLGTSHIPAHTHGQVSLTGGLRISENMSVNSRDVARTKDKWGIVSTSSTTGNVVVVKNGYHDIVQGSRFDDNIGINATHTHSSVGGGGAHNHGNTGASGTLTSAAGGNGNTGASGTLTSAAGGTGKTGASGTGATGSSSTLQPYITCYMWKRTA